MGGESETISGTLYRHRGRRSGHFAEVLVIGIVIVTLFLSVIGIGMYRRSDLYTYRRCLQTAKQHYSGGDYKSAMEFYMQALELRPDSAEAEDGVFEAKLALAQDALSGYELLEENFSGEALDDCILYYKSLIRMRPEESGLYVQAAQAYLLQGEYVQAVEVLRRGYEKTGKEELAEREAYVREHVIARTMTKRRNGSPVRVYTYDRDGNVLAEAYYKAEDDEEPYREIIYIYDEDQKPIRLEGRDRNEDSDECYFTVYYYDESGRAMGNMTQYSERWTGGYLTYDQSGRVHLEEMGGGSGEAPGDPRLWEKEIERVHVYEDLADGGWVEVELWVDFSESTDSETESEILEDRILELWVSEYDAAGHLTECRAYGRILQEIVVPEDYALWGLAPEEILRLGAADWLERLEAPELEDVYSVTYCSRTEHWTYDESGREILYVRDFGMTRATEYDEEQRVAAVYTDYGMGGSLTEEYVYDEWGRHVRTKQTRFEQDGHTGYNYIYYDYMYDYVGEPLWNPAPRRS